MRHQISRLYPANSPEDLFHRYVNHQITTTLDQRFANCMRDDMAGSLCWEISGEHEGFRFTAIYASPCWEEGEDLNVIPVHLFGEEESPDYKVLPSAAFPLNNWSMDLEQDLAAYLQALSAHLESLGITFKAIPAEPAQLDPDDSLPEPKQYPDQYLHVTECRSGHAWIVPIADNEPLDLRALITKWAESEYSGELSIDGEIMPRLDGDYYAKIMTDNRAPESAVCWTGGGFYLKAKPE